MRGGEWGGEREGKEEWRETRMWEEQWDDERRVKVVFFPPEDGGTRLSLCGSLAWWFGEKMKITLPGITTLLQCLLLPLVELRRIQSYWVVFFFLAHFGWLEFSKQPVWWNILRVQLSWGQISGISEFVLCHVHIWYFWSGAELSRLLNRESKGIVHSG